MDRYDIGRKIGEGSFGKVYFATKKSTGEEVRAETL
jgi:serine/threonine protein kinase